MYVFTGKVSDMKTWDLLYLAKHLRGWEGLVIGAETRVASVVMITHYRLETPATHLLFLECSAVRC